MSIQSRLCFATIFGGLIMISSAAAAPVVTSCGAPISSIVRTDNFASSTTSTAFGPVPGGANAVVNVPAGTTRCIRVTFSASANCLGGDLNEVCFIRAIENGSELNPITGGTLGFTPSDESAKSANSFQWAKRVGPGSHTIIIQRRVNAAATNFTTYFWSLTVEVTN